MPRGPRRLALGLRAAEGDEALEAAGAASEIDAERSVSSEDLSGVLEELLDDRPQRQGREEGERADDDHDADEEDRRTAAPVVGNVPSDGATLRLAAIEPARARIGMIIP